jgi:hypothetical protein
MAITTYSKSCSKNVAGNSGLYVTEVANVSSITVTAGEISAVTMASTSVFFEEAQGDIDTIQRLETGAGTGKNMAYTHRVNVGFSKPSTELNTFRNSLADATPCGILAIVTDANGTSWLVGYNATDGFKRPLRLVQDDLDSGLTPTDEAGQAITIGMECVNGYVCMPFDDTLGPAISGGTSTFIDYV